MKKQKKTLKSDFAGAFHSLCFKLDNHRFQFTQKLYLYVYVTGFFKPVGTGTVLYFVWTFLPSVSTGLAGWRYSNYQGKEVRMHENPKPSDFQVFWESNYCLMLPVCELGDRS